MLSFFKFFSTNFLLDLRPSFKAPPMVLLPVPHASDKTSASLSSGIGSNSAGWAKSF